MRSRLFQRLAMEPTGEKGLENLHKIREPERLHDVCIRPERNRPIYVLLIIRCTQDDNRDPGQVWLATHPLGEFEPVPLRHFQIGDDQRRQRAGPVHLGKVGDGLLAVRKNMKRGFRFSFEECQRDEIDVIKVVLNEKYVAAVGHTPPPNLGW